MNGFCSCSGQGDPPHHPSCAMYAPPVSSPPPIMGEGLVDAAKDVEDTVHDILIGVTSLTVAGIPGAELERIARDIGEQFKGKVITTPSLPEGVLMVEAAEQVISAWAFAHNIDGAARNDLFKRLRAMIAAAPASPKEPSDD